MKVGKIKKIISFVKSLLLLMLGMKISNEMFKHIISRVNQIKRNNFIYEFLLKRYDKKVTLLKYDSAEFVGSGGGQAINLYRKVKVKDEFLFEKIYFNDTKEFKNTIYFYDKIFEQLSDVGVKTPALKYKISGNSLSVLYFKFIEDKNNNESVGKDFFLDFDNKMKKLPVIEKEELEDFQIFTSAKMYKKNKQQIISYYGLESKNEITQKFNNIEKYFLNKVLWYQHSDLHKGNVVNKEYVIDFDTAAYYPYNYDLGTIYAWSFLAIMKKDIDNWELFESTVRKFNQGKRDIGFEFSLLIHFARFYSSLNTKILFDRFYDDYESQIVSLK